MANSSDGADSNRISFIFIRTENPKSINIDNPKLEKKAKIGDKYTPIKSPTPPNNCNTPVRTLLCGSL